MDSIKKIISLAICSVAISCMTGIDAKDITQTPHHEEEFVYSSFYSTESSNLSMESESTSSFFFNDGMDRLTQFEVTMRSGTGTLTIRQNMNVVYQKSYTVKNNRFSVKRMNIGGQITFQILIGEHTLEGAIDNNDKWVVTEVKVPPAMTETPIKKG